MQYTFEKNTFNINDNNAINVHRNKYYFIF